MLRAGWVDAGAMNMIPHVAKRKTHRCDECGRMIPIGARYWASPDGEIRQHTNCLDYEDEPLLPLFFNKNRSSWNKRERTYPLADDWDGSHL